MGNNSATYAEKLYAILLDDEYHTGKFRQEDLGEGMSIVYQAFGEWDKPRYLINHNLHTAYEWMNGHYRLTMVTDKDIDWHSMENLPEDARSTVRKYSFMYPSFIRQYHNGIALVKWQINPDGDYYMDEDGFGMTNDREYNVYGFIDQEGRVVSKFHYYVNWQLQDGILDKVRQTLEQERAAKH